MEIKEQQEFLNTISNGRTIVFYHSSSCPSCRSIEPFFDEQVKLCQNEQLQFLKVNITDFPEIAQENNIRSVPTFVSYVNGVSTKRFTGAYRDEVERMISKNIKMLNE
ncbi:thioredoxin, putative [Entamoeba histolytica HM-1:IMSS-B]|uniref:Thioredoxin, putative n=6 Tax=Entamoeba histolytica TaxID=5759 RepID=C4MAX5_ENTH1|nr:thioredoxin, putative [Entamoeba histolytica HM-1:IMSS]EMD43424.1 thioredoxin, putative [Entamoeba histolytica KU27]EMH72590.1 thioredoxin, putative [Entamoeba histolytica HM-1:IMSS-B]EMS15479.1 thioredoxin, putative [Entamoeba histolytica HM-3:IMSS]ENY63081.1 thioredoxin, putative [Entamoeba histolytica HM-1:IMSS-A]GAT99018.1 thioredoxin putative [Entamoeba histolytica]|eukprot:XP_649564.1 thioredoxin, putative [Entamoeba histolytica HM-1:IMSS]